MLDGMECLLIGDSTAAKNSRKKADLSTKQPSRDHQSSVPQFSSRPKGMQPLRLDRHLSPIPVKPNYHAPSTPFYVTAAASRLSCWTNYDALAAVEVGGPLQPVKNHSLQRLQLPPTHACQQDREKLKGPGEFKSSCLYEKLHQLLRSI